MEENRKKVTEENLEMISGGSWWDSKADYESGDTPLYSPGQVIKNDVLGDLYIQRVNEGKHGLFNLEFTYYVVYADDHSKVYDDNAYESQLIELSSSKGGLESKPRY